jgi:hypothetical protein
MPFASPYAALTEAWPPRRAFPSIRGVLGERQTSLTILSWPQPAGTYRFYLAGVKQPQSAATSLVFAARASLVPRILVFTVALRLARALA